MKSLLAHLRQLMNRIPYKQIAFFALIMGTSYALAQGSPAGEPQSDSDVIRAIVQILNLVFTLITFLLTPAIILAGWLLSPDWTMGDFFGLRPYFINVWVLVSNLVYIVFALMLLWMAVMQIFSGESKFAFKQKLPRFLVGIMIVPFTWLIVSWTLSFANQAVAAVLSIPAGAIGGISGDVSADGKKGLFHQQTIPTKFVIDFGSDAPGTPTCTKDGVTEDGQTKCISPAEFIAFNESGPFFIIMVYAYDIFKIQNTEQVNFEAVCAGGADVKECVNSIGKLLRKFGVALITTIFFAIILIALCWVLLARAFKLWIYVMFSPLFGLAYAVTDEGLGKNLESEGGGEGVSLGKVGFVPFFQLAMVPVLVSAVLSFGLLFIGVMNNTFTTGALAPTGSGGFCTKGDFMVKYCIEEDSTGGYSSRLIIGNSMNPSGGDYTITFEFGSMISDFVGNSAGGGVIGPAAGGLAAAGTDIFAHIIMSIIAIAVMWVGVKAAVSYDEVTQKAFAPFAKLGDSVGNFVQNIPSYLPTPHPAFAALTPGGVTAATSTFNKFQEEKTNDFRKTGEEMWNGTGRRLEGALDGLDTTIQKNNNAINEMGPVDLNSPGYRKGIQTLFADAAKSDKLQGNQEFQEFNSRIQRADRQQEFRDLFGEMSENSDFMNALSTANATGLRKVITGSSSSTDQNIRSRFAPGLVPGEIKFDGNVLNSNDVSSLNTDAKNALRNILKKDIGDQVTISNLESIRSQLREVTGQEFTQSVWTQEKLEELRKSLWAGI